ncbi:MAG: hypothetical protein D6705_08515 [Deltaproteobacteria bacterium]|nr:MAG: hypothetical protein D6705_08515 [Deltaproteobacteria bacterium]
MYARKLSNEEHPPTTCAAPVPTFPTSGLGDASCDVAGRPPPRTKAEPRRRPEPVPEPLVAHRPDGVAYAGDLARDVVRYRTLRARTLAGDMLTSEDLDGILNLESKLRQQVKDDEVCGLRTFQRFDCRFEVMLRRPAIDGRAGLDAVVEAEDMSAGGLKLRADLDVEAGESIDVFMWLDEHTRVRFGSRVAWVGPGVFGVMFAGPPDIEQVG